MCAVEANKARIEAFYRQECDTERLSASTFGLDDIVCVENFLPEGSITDRHGSGWIAMHLTLSGSTRLERRTCNGLEHAILRKGSITVSPPSYWSSADWTSHHLFSVFASPNFLAGVISSMNKKTPEISAIGGISIRNAQIERLMWCLYGALRQQVYADQNFFAEALCNALFSQLITGNCSKEVGSLRTVSGLAPWQLRRTYERMASCLEQECTKPTLSELARSVGLSVSHFCRAFRVSTGLPPHQWMTMKQMERAASLLVESHLSVEQIAGQLGLDSHALARAFRKSHGLSPTEYRRQKRY